MSTYLLTWNPAKWTFEDWPQALIDIASHGFYIRQWSCINAHAVVGDTVLLKKTGNGLTGIIASGTVIAAPYLNSHWGKGLNRVLKQYILIKFDRLADYTKGEILPVSNSADFGYPLQSSGCLLSPDKAASLLDRFRAYVAAPVVAPIILGPTNKKRVAMSPRLRWMILDRDAHTCQDCGRSAPTVVLHVDHRISQKSWREQHGNLDGVNDPQNLAATCSDCNLGKGAKNSQAAEEK